METTTILQYPLDDPHSRYRLVLDKRHVSIEFEIGPAHWGTKAGSSLTGLCDLQAVVQIPEGFVERFEATVFKPKSQFQLVVVQSEARLSVSVVDSFGATILANAFTKLSAKARKNTTPVYYCPHGAPANVTVTVKDSKATLTAVVGEIDLPDWVGSLNTPETFTIAPEQRATLDWSEGPVLKDNLVLSVDGKIKWVWKPTGVKIYEDKTAQIFCEKCGGQRKLAFPCPNCGHPSPRKLVNVSGATSVSLYSTVEDTARLETKGQHVFIRLGQVPSNTIELPSWVDTGALKALGLGVCAGEKTGLRWVDNKLEMFSGDDLCIVWTPKGAPSPFPLSKAQGIDLGEHHAVRMDLATQKAIVADLKGQLKAANEALEKEKSNHANTKKFVEEISTESARLRDKVIKLGKDLHEERQTVRTLRTHIAAAKSNLSI